MPLSQVDGYVPLAPSPSKDKGKGKTSPGGGKAGLGIKGSPKGMAKPPQGGQGNREEHREAGKEFRRRNRAGTPCHHELLSRTVTATLRYSAAEEFLLLPRTPQDAAGRDIEVPESAFDEVPCTEFYLLSEVLAAADLVTSHSAAVQSLRSETLGKNSGTPRFQFIQAAVDVDSDPNLNHFEPVYVRTRKVDKKDAQKPRHSTGSGGPGRHRRPEGGGGEHPKEEGEASRESDAAGGGEAGSGGHDTGASKVSGAYMKSTNCTAPHCSPTDSDSTDETGPDDSKTKEPRPSAKPPPGFHVLHRGRRSQPFPFLRSLVVGSVLMQVVLTTPVRLDERVLPTVSLLTTSTLVQSTDAFEVTAQALSRAIDRLVLYFAVPGPRVDNETCNASNSSGNSSQTDPPPESWWQGLGASWTFSFSGSVRGFMAGFPFSSPAGPGAWATNGGWIFWGIDKTGLMAFGGWWPIVASTFLVVLWLGSWR